MSRLAVDRLTVRYGGEAVVDDLSFMIDRGEAVGLVGESGSGKTQTALALLGLLPGSATTEGSIRLGADPLCADGVFATERELDRLRSRRIALVFQDPALALNPCVRIGHQLAQIVIRHGVASRREAPGRVIEALARVGLPDPERQARAYAHQLSGGMRQRAMIAAALIAEPELLVADEPTTALDVTVQAQVLELLAEIRQETALLLITHDLGCSCSRRAGSSSRARHAPCSNGPRMRTPALCSTPSRTWTAVRRRNPRRHRRCSRSRASTSATASPAADG